MFRDSKNITMLPSSAIRDLTSNYGASNYLASNGGRPLLPKCPMGPVNPQVSVRCVRLLHGLRGPLLKTAAAPWS